MKGGASQYCCLLFLALGRFLMSLPGAGSLRYSLGWCKLKELQGCYRFYLHGKSQISIEPIVAVLPLSLNDSFGTKQDYNLIWFS